MGERSAYTPGTFCWADVAGADLEAQRQVTFTVPDAQDAVRRAAALGGGEIVPPTSTAIGDIAVVCDPAGASFGLFAGQVGD